MVYVEFDEDGWLDGQLYLCGVVQVLDGVLDLCLNWLVLVEFFISELVNVKGVFIGYIDIGGIFVQFVFIGNVCVDGFVVEVFMVGFKFCDGQVILSIVDVCML